MVYVERILGAAWSNLGVHMPGNIFSIRKGGTHLGQFQKRNHYQVEGHAFALVEA